MYSRSSLEEPPERSACPAFRGQATIHLGTLHPQDPAARAALEEWLKAIPVLEGRSLSSPTRSKLQDSRRICEEVAQVLAGVEPGEGRRADRRLLVSLARGRFQALSSLFACPGGTFVELVATAPWNLLGSADPPDPRTVHGAGSALLAAATDWSWRRGCAGRVALQAENPRCLAFYERLGFCRMAPDDQPLSLVPRGENGWSPSILRVAHGAPGPEEERSPWLLRDPSRGARGLLVDRAMSSVVDIRQPVRESINQRERNRRTRR